LPALEERVRHLFKWRITHNNAIYATVRNNEPIPYYKFSAVATWHLPTPRTDRRRNQSISITTDWDTIPKFLFMRPAWLQCRTAQRSKHENQMIFTREESLYRQSPETVDADIITIDARWVKYADFNNIAFRFRSIIVLRRRLYSISENEEDEL
jgi:hypothetical protein